MKTFYINLEHRRDRRDHMEAMLSSFNINYERFNAIQPTINDIKNGEHRHLYEKAIPRVKKYINTQQMNPRGIGIFGVFLSHLKIHQNQVGNLEPYMILEDDVIFTHDTLTKLDEIMTCKKYTDWDIIRSMWMSSNLCEKIEGVHRRSAFAKDNKVHTLYGGAHFSIFKNASKVVNYILQENFMPIDCIYSTNILNVYHRKMNVYTDFAKFGTDIPKLK